MFTRRTFVGSLIGLLHLPLLAIASKPKTTLAVKVKFNEWDRFVYGTVEGTPEDKIAFAHCWQKAMWPDWKESPASHGRDNMRLVEERSRNGESVAFYLGAAYMGKAMTETLRESFVHACLNCGVECVIDDPQNILMLPRA